MATGHDEEEVRFEPRDEAVVARRVVRLGALVLQEQAADGRSGERIAAAAVRRHPRARAWTACRGPTRARQLQARVALLRRREPGRLARLSDDALLADLEDWLAPQLIGLRRLGDLAALDLRGDPAEPAGPRPAPRAGAAGAGAARRAERPVDSRSTTPPTRRCWRSSCRSCSGWPRRPRVDDGRMPLTLQLLSPAQRPVAVTRDLAGFWATGYPAVRKELRGRYPKHPWPEDPLTAPATHRARKAVAAAGPLAPVRGAAEHALEHHGRHGPDGGRGRTARRASPRRAGR